MGAMLSCGDYEYEYTDDEFELLIPKVNGNLGIQYKYEKSTHTFEVTGVSKDEEVMKEMTVSPGDVIISIWNVSVDKCSKDQFQEIISKSGGVVLMRFRNASSSSSQARGDFDMEIDKTTSSECDKSLKKFDIDESALLADNSNPHEDILNAIQLFREEAGSSNSWQFHWYCLGGEGLGLNVGESGTLSILTYKDLSFELTFGTSSKCPPCNFRCKIRESKDGNPKPHVWIYDVDDGGIGVEGKCWRGVLVLSRAHEAIVGKHPGDRLVGDMGMESSAGQEQNFKVIFEKMP